MITFFKKFNNLKITGGIIYLLELFYGKDYLAPKLEHLRTLQHGTVGREIAEILDSKNYRLIPKFESHDLKHLVLEYENIERLIDKITNLNQYVYGEELLLLEQIRTNIKMYNLLIM